MPSSSPSTFADLDVNSLYGHGFPSLTVRKPSNTVSMLTGQSSGLFPIGGFSSVTRELVVLKGRQTSKSLWSQYQKIWVNSKYGKMGTNLMDFFSKFDFKPAYKGETKVEVPYWHDAEFYEWCKETFGEGGRHSRYSWRKNQVKSGTYFFKREEDLTLIRMRWL